MLALAVVTIVSACAPATSVVTHAMTATNASNASAEIAAARARSNAAIAAHDLDGIAREWMPDVHVVSSAGTQNGGIHANSRSMQAAFTRRPDTKWVRTPHTITVNERWDVASEEGRWVGTWTEPDGPLRMAGTYLAQWRREGGRWRIQAEVFVPVECEGGAYCSTRP
jgi:ketosteroid isomerase-like protein